MKEMGGKTRGFDCWALGQMQEEARCRIEPTMSCLPLRDDPICQACHETDLEQNGMECTESQSHAR